MTPMDLPTTPHVTEGPENDGFFSDLVNTKPYLKCAFQGFAGSGKTYTMAQVAIGLHRRIKSSKPVVFFDTEKAGKFLRPIFDDAGIKILYRESRSPADLIETMRRCKSGVTDILMVDSMSHIWEAFVEAYKKKKGSKRLEMLDCGVIKPSWKAEISDPFVRDPYHFMFAGRAGYEYDNEINPETKKREIYKSGIKMKIEGETAYEPDLLVLMERFEEIMDEDKKVWREATVLKDRSTLIDGKTFKNPTYEAFSPAIERMLANPTETSTAPELDTGNLFHTEEDKRTWLRRRDIALEKIEGELTAAFPGQAADAKRAKIDALESAFATKSWTEITGKRPEDLEIGIEAIKKFIRQAQMKAA